MNKNAGAFHHPKHLRLEAQRHKNMKTSNSAQQDKYGKKDDKIKPDANWYTTTTPTKMLLHRDDKTMVLLHNKIDMN